ncbi:MAG: dockerin type I repeat-containing protein [Acidobacteria bacterium]|nr:dockerin type I repeat-containing protein [Acidobacteriota bacterium]
MGVRHSVIMLVLLLVILVVGNAQAAIEVESWPLPVDPDSTGARIGPFSLVFSGPDLAAPGNTDEFYYVLVRVSMTEGVFIYRTWAPCQVTDPPLACWYEMELAVEVVSGNPWLPAMDAVRIKRVGPDYIDILFCRNMNLWNLTSQNRVRITFGTLSGETPQGPSNLWPGMYQGDTSTCCCFSESDTDFVPDGEWGVEFQAYYSNVAGEILGDFPATFAPDSAVLAVAGPPLPVCDITAGWPVGAGLPGISPGPQDILEYRFCPWGECTADGWIDYCDDPVAYAEETTPRLSFGAGHMFVISETCEPNGSLFEEEDWLQISIYESYELFEPAFITDASQRAWLTGGGLADPIPLTVDYDPNDDYSINVHIDPVVPLDPDRTAPLEIWIDLGNIQLGNVCGDPMYHLVRGPFDFYVNALHYPAHMGCGFFAGPIIKFIVARLLECLRGDLDEDGAITAVDILLLADYQAGMVELDAAQLVEVDRNDDCLIDATDLMRSLIPWYMW